MKNKTKNTRRFSNTTDDKAKYIKSWTNHINELHTLAFYPGQVAQAQVCEAIIDLEKMIKVIADARYDKADKSTEDSPATVVEFEEQIQTRLRERINNSLRRWAVAKRELKKEQPKGQCEDAPCCGCCGGDMADGYGTPADDAWHDAHEYPEW